MSKDFVPNPCTPGGRKPVTLITDRAKRYRAQKNAPAGNKRCYLCGAPPRGRTMDVDHIDGHEAHGNPENLAWACRSCNTAKGAHFAKKRRGKRTRQYNPSATGGGAKSLGAWMEAVLSLKGQGTMPLSEAIALVHATPANRRSEFASMIWDRRRQHGTDKQVPF